MVMIERLQRDLERARREYERSKEKLSEVKAEVEERKEAVERLETALDVVSDYEGADDSDQFLAGDDYSISEAAEAVLRRADEPLSIGAVTNSMLERGFRYSKSADKLRRSVSGVLSREDTFERVERGVYTLKDANNYDDDSDKSINASSQNDETPSPAATE